METALVAPSDGQTDLKALNEQERADLLACEETIGRDLRSFVEVGLALVKIRDERLYRQDYYDFDQYCRHRWGVSRIHAHRNIEAAKVHEMLPVGNKPANEAQVRPLTRIRTEDGALDQRAITRVWQRVVDYAPTDDAGRKVITAKVVEEAAQPVLRRRGIKTGSGVRSRRSSSAPANDGTAAKINISDEEFARLHEHVEKLAKMMITEAIPVPVRLVIEDVCDIVLGDRD
jgi:hypothetical protein